MEAAWIERKRRSDEPNYTPKAFNQQLGDDAEFMRDRARIIHSSAFRRLQAKTQVLNLGDGDYYRTRLTHSLEVMQIGSSIAHKLRGIVQDGEELKQWLPTQNLIEAICLAHDLGHPPFGHGGERALNSKMYKLGGFEGNGQTIRIATKLGEFSPANGLDLTRRSLLGLVKYPALHKKVARYGSGSQKNLGHLTPPKCVHDEEEDVLKWILLPFSKSDKKLLLKTTAPAKNSGKHSKTLNKSFDASIMDVADDIAYGVHDLEDAIALNLVSQQELVESGLEAMIEEADLGINKTDRTMFFKKVFSGTASARKHAISSLVVYLMDNIEVTTVPGAHHPLIKYRATLKEDASMLVQKLKSFVYDHVIIKPQVQALEYKGQQIVNALFDAYANFSERLLPAAYRERIKTTTNPSRVISDYVSGMTDNFASSQYMRLFVPDIGSVFDRS